MNRMGFVYIMTNKNKTTLYIGVTNDLCRRIYEHKNHLIKNSFTDKYNLEHCIYYEEFPYFDMAIQREKELKKWNRQKKEDLINKKNPEWKVLVTEKGFVHNTIPFSQQVAYLVNELQQKEEVPPVGRNDERLQVGIGEIGGGLAATNFSPSSLGKPVIPNETQCSEETPSSLGKPVISSEARKLNESKTKEGETL